MNNLTYPTFVWRCQRNLALFSALVIFALQYFIVWLFSTVEYSPLLKMFFEEIPPLIRSIFHDEFLKRMSLDGAAAFGFDHPLVLAFMTLNAIIIPSRHIAGAIETGTMELMLAYPVGRLKLLISMWLTACVALMVVSFGAFAGSCLSALFYHDAQMEFLRKMALICLNLWLFFILIMTYSTMTAAFEKEGGRSGVISAGITLLFFFAHILATFWKDIEFIKPYNIFTYFQPQQLMFGERSLGFNSVVLGVLISVCLVISAARFHGRDIPG